MRISIRQLPGITSLALAVFLVSPGPLAGAPKKMAMPDLTKGERQPGTTETLTFRQFRRWTAPASGV